MIHGRNILIYADGQVLALARECVINNSCEVIEVSSPDSARSREFIPGRTAWTCNVSGLVPVDGMADYVLKAGTVVRMIMAEVSEEKHMRRSGCLIGNAICTSTQVSCTIGKLAQGTTAWQGSGELEHVTRGSADVEIVKIFDRDPQWLPFFTTIGYRIARTTDGKLSELYHTEMSPPPRPLPETSKVTPGANTRYNYNGTTYMWDSHAQEFLPLEVFIIREHS